MIGSFPIGSVPIGSNQLAGLEVLPLGVAGATSAGLLLNIGIQMGQGSATAQGLTASEYISLQLGQAQADTTLFDVIPKTTLDLVFAHAIASAEPLGNLQIRLKIGRADSDAQALNVIPKTVLSAGQALANSQGFDFSGIAISMLPAGSTAEMNRAGIGVSLLSKNVSSQALEVIPLAKLDLEVAGSEADAYPFEPMILNLIIGDLIASAKDADLAYIVTGVPDIIVTRSEDLTQNLLKVLNDTLGNVNIYRADDHKGLFELISQNQSSPYTDSGLDETLNYKYKAAFIVTGTKGGETVVVEGEKSLPRYTIGNKIL